MTERMHNNALQLTSGGSMRASRASSMRRLQLSAVLDGLQCAIDRRSGGGIVFRGPFSARSRVGPLIQTRSTIGMCGRVCFVTLAAAGTGKSLCCGKKGKKRRRCQDGQEKQRRENDCGQETSGEGAWWKGAR